MGALTVLLADDIPENGRVLSLFLGDLGFRVIEAEDWRTALQTALREKPDTVILDIMMPEMDGIEVCRSLKTNPTTKTVQVIMVTAYSDERNHLLALEAGADDFLPKPFNVHFLKARLKSLLSLKVLHDATPKRENTSRG